MAEFPISICTAITSSHNLQFQASSEVSIFKDCIRLVIVVARGPRSRAAGHFCRENGLVGSDQTCHGKRCDNRRFESSKHFSCSDSN
jgi:hypothetical protein